MKSEFDDQQTLAALRHFLPVAPGEMDLRSGRTGVVLVDPVVGFTREGALSDPESMAPMVAKIDALCRHLIDVLGERVVFFVFRDHHGPDQIEPPYPPHCQEGTGEEELDPDLRWLEARPDVTLFDKDCINGMIGALDAVESYALPTVSGGSEELSTYRHRFVEWVVGNELDRLVVVGDCTDICDLDFVVAVLSARNHGMLGEAWREREIWLYEPACATYHLPDPESLGLPLTARHHRDLTHHAALYFMQARGARIADSYLA